MNNPGSATPATVCFALCDLVLGITVGLMRLIKLLVFGSAVALTVAMAQSPPGRNPDVSNKALITKSTPRINADQYKNQNADAAVHKLADDYYSLSKEKYPRRSSDARLDAWGGSV